MYFFLQAQYDLLLGHYQDLLNIYNQAPNQDNIHVVLEAHTKAMNAYYELTNYIDSHQDEVNNIEEVSL